MKRISALFLTLLLAFTLAVNVSAQSNESIWLTASTTSFKTGETVKVMLNAASATPIQGFTFQVRYDPACLKPVNASSPITGMNGLPLPQLSGLVDGSYASTAPVMVNGALAEIRFTTLGACNTNLTLESAALAIRNAEGFAAPLAGVAIGEKNVALVIDKEVVSAQAAEPETGSMLALDPPAEKSGLSGWLIGLLVVIVIGAGAAFGLSKLLRNNNVSTSAAPRKESTSKQPAAQTAVLYVKHGPQAGQSFPLNHLPVLIGRNPLSDICINDPHIIDQHARIFANNNTFYLMDLGGETVINGKSIQKSSVILKPGDVVRLGKRSLFVFG
jgi:hypothetical protein